MTIYGSWAINFAGAGLGPSCWELGDCWQSDKCKVTLDDLFCKHKTCLFGGNFGTKVAENGFQRLNITIRKRLGFFSSKDNFRSDHSVAEVNLAIVGNLCS